MSEYLPNNHQNARSQRDNRRPLHNRRRAAGLLFSSVWGAALTCSAAGFAFAGNTDEPTAAEQAPTASAGDLTPAVLLDDLETGSREKQARLVRLRMSLQRLSEESRRMREQPPAQSTPPTPPAPGLDEPPQPAADADLEPLMPELSPSDPHVVPEPPTDEHVHPAGDAHGHGTAPPAPEPTSSTSETVVGTSINRLALGDSLFGTGQTELALQAYSSIELNRLTASDRYWIEYQIANCHRRLGNIPEAQTRYRKLAGLVDAGWCAGHAKWWLDALNTRAALQRDLVAVKNSLKSMEEQLNAKPSQ
jgi:hypothetical protein